MEENVTKIENYGDKEDRKRLVLDFEKVRIKVFWQAHMQEFVPKCVLVEVK